MPTTVARLVADAASPSRATTPDAPTAVSAPGPSPAQEPAGGVSYVPPWVQRAEDGPAAAPDLPAVADRSAPVTADAGDSRPPPRSDADLHELARALYPQLRRQLGRDLLLDRERLGYRTDIRY